MDINLENKRILVVDDDKYVRKAYQKILAPKNNAANKLNVEINSLKQEIFGESDNSSLGITFDIELCSQGKEAVEKIKEARESGAPYSVAFIDVVMPPGPDGIWTARQIRILDRNINIVIVTAHSNTPVEEINQKVKPADKLFYLRKPFQSSEIRQFAIGLASKWQSERMLNEIIEDQRANLAMTNIALHEEMDGHSATKETLRNQEETVREKSQQLDSMGATFETMFGKRLERRKNLESEIMLNMKELIEPNLVKLKQTSLDSDQEKLLNIIEAHMEAITSPFMRQQDLRNYRFTSNEIHVAKLIIRGNSSAEICKLLNLSKRTIDFYRERMRDKLGIKNTSTSLKAKLMELEQPK